MEKIKQIHNKFGKCFNQSFTRGFSGAMNVFGNIVPRQKTPNISMRKARHYDDVSKFIDNSWRTVGGHLKDAILDVNETLGSAKLTKQEINGFYQNSGEEKSGSSSYYSSNTKNKMEVANEW